MRSTFAHIGIVLLIALTVAGSADAATTYRFGMVYGLGNLKAAEKPYFGFNHLWGATFGIGGERMTVNMSLLSGKNYSDSTASGHFGFFPDKNAAERAFTSLRVGLDFDYSLTAHNAVRPIIGAGLGYLIWEYTDPAGDTVVQTAGERGNRVDFSATELFVSGMAGMEAEISPRFSLTLKAGLDYLTGIGTSFADSVDDARGRMMMRATLALSYRFGAGGNAGRPSAEYWPSTQSWSRIQTAEHPKPAVKDTDGDGVEDKKDRCPGTPAGALVDRSGCPLDADADGVPDGIDACPKTPPASAGFVDIYGCPVDADFDGVPDYRDRCRSGPVGAVVDENGCPLDSDGDGVYDGLDDCPDTAPGIEVDKRGCIDIAFLRDTMRINVDYPSGSFEVDPRTRERLQPLIRKLKILTDVHIDISGYTDNIGPSEANLALSQKRANRMRDWLESEGIAADRLKAVGKGETNFVASNDTAEGRAENRRIEFVFHK
jgi:OOP family OmpA-OmpF porin